MYPTNTYIYYVYLKKIFVVDVVIIINIHIVVSETGSHVAQDDFLNLLGR